MGAKKRFLLVTIPFLLLFSLLSGCGTKASEKAVSVAKSAIEAADNYLDNKISADRARNQLSKLQEEMDYVSNLEIGAENKGADTSIDVSIMLLSTNILNDDFKPSSDSYNKVLQKRNELAEIAGLPKR